MLEREGERERGNGSFSKCLDEDKARGLNSNWVFHMGAGTQA